MRINPVVFRYFEGDYFEQLIMEIYGYLGYDIRTTSVTGDQGVDLIMSKGNEKIAVQCKRYKANISNKAVQEVFSGMYYYKCNKAMVVTSSSFTRGAKQLANSLNVELIDCNSLANILSIGDNFIGNNFYKNERLTQILINAGCDLLENGVYVEAIELLGEIINEKENILNKKDLLNAYNYLALSYRRLENFTQAEAVYLEGVTFDDSNILLNNLAIMYRDLGRYHESLGILNIVLRNPKDDLYSHYQNQRDEVEKLVQLKNNLNACSISLKEYHEAVDLIMRKFR